jgi:hypothetical protein
MSPPRAVVALISPDGRRAIEARATDNPVVIEVAAHELEVRGDALEWGPPVAVFKTVTADLREGGAFADWHCEPGALRRFLAAVAGVLP